MIACHFHESKGTVIFMKARELSPGQTGYMKFNVSIIIYYISIVADKLNICVHATTKTTPYQLVFGQPPHSSPFPGTTKGIVMEEAVSDILGAVHMCSLYLYKNTCRLLQGTLFLWSLIFCTHRCIFCEAEIDSLTKEL